LPESVQFLPYSSDDPSQAGYLETWDSGQGDRCKSNERHDEQNDHAQTYEGEPSRPEFAEEVAPCAWVSCALIPEHNQAFLHQSVMAKTSPCPVIEPDPDSFSATIDPAAYACDTVETIGPR
jgi:hypothetical protein